MIRFVFRWAFRLLLLIIVLVIGLLLLKDTIVRSLAEQHLRRKTGFETKIGKVDVGLLDPKFTLENVVIYNPPDFGGSKLLDAPEIHLEYEPGKLVLGKVHLTFLRLKLRELNIVESGGRTNLLEWFSKATPGATGTRGGQKSAGYSLSGVDLLNLSIGLVRYNNLERPKRSQEIKLNLENQLLRNVSNEEDFLKILFKLLFRAGITIYPEDRPR